MLSASKVGLRAQMGLYNASWYMNKTRIGTRSLSLLSVPRPSSCPTWSCLHRPEAMGSHKVQFGTFLPVVSHLFFPQKIFFGTAHSHKRARLATAAVVVIWMMMIPTIAFAAVSFLHLALHFPLRILWNSINDGDNLYELGQRTPSATRIYGAYADRFQSIVRERREISRLVQPEAQGSIYSELAEDELRVLILEPGAQEDEIECRLCTCRYSDMVSYQALSYAWGDPTKVMDIQCNGKSMKVASNLHQALLHLRHPWHQRIFWIDALCINQDDSKERGHQVQNMRNIYAEAKQVLVWLGRGSKDSEGAFQYLLDGPGLIPTWAPDGLNFSTEPRITSGMTEDVMCLMERPWFRRLWVLQEVAYGKKVVLMAGKQTISWDLFAQSVQTLYRSGWIMDHFSRKAKIGAAAVIEMETVRQFQQGSRVGGYRSHRSLLSVLLATHSGECSDARDRIYAVLNLAGDYDSRRDVSVLGPNYSLDPRETFIRFAQWCVGREDLGFLSCTTRAVATADKRLEITSLPSWVPDWTSIDNDSPFVRYLDRVPFEADIGLHLMPHDPPRITENNELTLFGTAIDVVKEVGSPSTFKKSSVYPGGVKQLVDIAHGNRAWLDECQDLSSLVHYNTQCGSKETFWRTVTAGLTGEVRIAPASFSSQFDDYVQLLKEISRLAQDSIEDTKTKQVSNLILSKFESKKHVCARIESSILMWASKRRFAVTENGMMALVPDTTRRGDVIAVVAGSKVPLVFRRIPEAVGKYHMVLGEAFVDGLMDGKVVESHVKDYKRLGKGYKRPLFKDFIVI